MSSPSTCYCDITDLAVELGFFTYIVSLFLLLYVPALGEGFSVLMTLDSSYFHTHTEGCRSAWLVDGSLQLVRCFASVCLYVCLVLRANTSDVHCLYIYVVEELEQWM